MSEGIMCEWPDGCENRAIKAWPSGEPCPHIMICGSHDKVKVGDPEAGALFNLWADRRAAARLERKNAGND